MVWFGFLELFLSLCVLIRPFFVQDFSVFEMSDAALCSFTNSSILDVQLVSEYILVTAWYFLSILPENIMQPLGFLMFSRGRDKQHRAVMSLALNSLLLQKNIGRKILYQNKLYAVLFVILQKYYRRECGEYQNSLIYILFCIIPPKGIMESHFCMSCELKSYFSNN